MYKLHCGMCSGSSTVSGSEVSAVRHMVLSRCVCFLHATGLGQLPSCIVVSDEEGPSL